MICSSDYSQKLGISIVYAFVIRSSRVSVCVYRCVFVLKLLKLSLVILFFIFSNTLFHIFNTADVFQDGIFF